MQPDDLITPKELAVRWGCSDQTIYNLLESGRLPKLLLGFGMRVKRYGIPMRAVIDWEIRRELPGEANA